MNKQFFMANLEYYKAFFYAAKYGSITAAAQKLCLTQPTVTNSIIKLEEQLGTSLFARNKKGVILTHEGRIIWNRIEPAFKLIMLGEHELEENMELKSGVLRIVSTEMSCRTYIIPNLEAFTSDYPDVKIRFKNALQENILNLVRDGEADIAILHVPPKNSDELEFRYLDSIEECFVGGPAYKKLAGSVHELEELLEYPIIALPEGAATREFAADLFETKGLRYEPDIEVTTIDLVIKAVEHNLGIGTLPVSEAEQGIKDGKMVRILTSNVPYIRDAYVITSKKIPLTQAAKTFLDYYLFKKDE